MVKRNIIEEGVTQNMERINRGANGRRQKAKVKGRRKGADRNVMGKRGEIKQETAIQSGSLYSYFFLFFLDAECGTPSHNSPLAIHDLTVY